MADDRRPARGSRPRGRTGPGRTPGAGRTGRARVSGDTGRPAGPVRPPLAGRVRTRPTGRAAILVLVLALLAVAYASSIRAYVQQRSENATLQAENAQRQAAIDETARQIRREKDPAYIRQDARSRLSFVMPGETLYIVVDENGDPIEPEATLSDPVDPADADPVAWWSDAWGSVELAGNPPKIESDPVPLTRIDGSEEGQE
jgi:cell division protein FtsB